MINIQEIEMVFGESPRNDGYWWPRGDENEGELNYFFSSIRGKHIALIDGPTGSGKTSIVERSLSENIVSYNGLVCDSDTDWKELCRQIVSVPKGKVIEDERKLGFSVKKFLPGGSVDTRHSERYDPLVDLEYSDKYLEKISVSTLAKLMIDESVTLVLDDFEKANKKFIKKVASLAKTLSTIDHKTAKSKLILITCIGSYSLLIDGDKTLSKRVLHLTLGGLVSRTHDWKFIQTGLDRLNIDYPGLDPAKSDKGLLQKCQEYTYDAAGGNLKSLTELGKKAALSITKSKILPAQRYTDIAKKYAQRNIDEYARKYSKITNVIHSCEYARNILNFLFKEGLTRPHLVVDLERALSEKGEMNRFPEALNILIQSSLLVATGKGQSTLFVSEPDFTLAFCVAIAKPTQYRVPSKLEAFSPNLSLEFDHDITNANKAFQRTSR